MKRAASDRCFPPRTARPRPDRRGAAATLARVLHPLALILFASVRVSAQEPVAQADATSLREGRQQLQTLELMPSRAGAWIFQVGAAPRIVWRDPDLARQLGADPAFGVRWFDRDLRESPQPDAGGRWMAMISGTSPNGSPMTRALTFFGFPKKLETTWTPDLTVQLPNFPGDDAPAAWREHTAEFDRAARELLFRGLVDSERGAILMAGIAEATELGRPRVFIEGTAVCNAERHLALRLKLAGLAGKPCPLKPPRRRFAPAPTLREGSPAEAGVPADAKVRIDRFCEDWAAATGVPFVTLVAQRGVVITHRGFGAEVDGQPVDTGYRCWIASLTKTVTAIQFLQLVDQGLVGLDDRLGAVLPGFDAFGECVPTFRQCLNHTSGLSGHADHGGVYNPWLDNLVLNGIDINRPGKKHEYCGLGFELAAKTMELVTGKPAARVYGEHLFQPLGFGDVILGDASSGAELTARELAVLGQWILNEGSYGELQFVSPATFREMLPRRLEVPGAMIPQGLGLHAVYHRKPGAPADSVQPADLLFGPHAVGHGSFSGCILMVDPDRDLVIAQARREFKPADGDWHKRFFETIAEALGDGAPSR